jgi:hypothetical protein
MYFAVPLMRSIGLDVVVPGIICLVLAAALLSCWELRRLTRTGTTAVDRWLPAAAITAGVVSLVLIIVRFIGVD